MDFFDGKVIIITGASSGIGLATAKLCASKGANVVLAARSIDKLYQIADGFPYKERYLCVKTDVTVEDDCKHLIDATVEKFGRIDILINNAGISMRALFKDLNLSVMKRLMDVNYWGTVYCTKYALKSLLESKGTVVGIISIMGYSSSPARTGYASSKFAIRGFLDALHIEHLHDGFHVLVFAPGFTASNIRNVALTADGSAQGVTPLDESKLMSAEKVAKLLLKAIRKHKNHVVLTHLGWWTVHVTNVLPNLVNKIQYKYMSNEFNSPLK